jgi:hypothetical protein
LLAAFSLLHLSGEAEGGEVPPTHSEDGQVPARRLGPLARGSYDISKHYLTRFFKRYRSIFLQNVPSHWAACALGFRSYSSDCQKPLFS